MYVSNSGLDTNSGSISSPKKTIQGAINALTSGIANNVIIRTGTYSSSGAIDVSKSGASTTSRLVFKPYGTETVNIVGTGDTDVIKVTGKSFITFQNLRISHTNPASIGGQGINIINGAKSVSVLNCVIYNIRSHAIQTFNGGSDGGVYNSSMNGFVFDGNTVYGCCQSNEANRNGNRVIPPPDKGWPSAIMIAWVGGGLMSNNVVYGNWGEGLNVVRATGVTVRNNYSRDNYSVNIYFDNTQNCDMDSNFSSSQQTSANLYYHNFFGWTSAQGIYINNEPGTTTLLTNDVQVSNNLVVNGVFCLAKTNSADNLRVINNTFYGCGNSRRVIYWKGTTGDSGNTVGNNIAYNANTTGTLGDITGVVGTNWLNNCWYRSDNSTNGRYAGTNDLVGAAASGNFVAGTGNSSTGLTKSDDVDFKLKSTAPSRNKGYTSGVVSDDYFGTARPQGGLFDIGFDEF